MGLWQGVLWVSKRRCRYHFLERGWGNKLFEIFRFVRVCHECSFTHPVALKVMGRVVQSIRSTLDGFPAGISSAAASNSKKHALVSTAYQ